MFFKNKPGHPLISSERQREIKKKEKLNNDHTGSKKERELKEFNVFLFYSHAHIWYAIKKQLLFLWQIIHAREND